ncbi:hypothetical protein M514_03246 [Trichuris suis]|uniref:Uncharacterized protein n=1 Tax=Trichuris suis TaxID=68888 RepID=A0A085MW13_9BILA|nr:hypothetical protein M513_03246 [Trichuris suis]KFD61409.1 hypothetical protein M514_03246 [Trichuris suis]
MQKQPTYEKRANNTDKDSYCNTFGAIAAVDWQRKRMVPSVCFYEIGIEGQHFLTRRREYYPEIKLELFMQLNAITQCHMQGNSEHVTPQTPGTAVGFKTT